jgi:hypothetical protein
MATLCTPQLQTLYTNCAGFNSQCYLYNLVDGNYVPVVPGWYSKDDKCAYVASNGYVSSICDCPRFYPISAVGRDCDTSTTVNFFTTNNTKYVVFNEGTGSFNADLNCWNSFTPPTGVWYVGSWVRDDGFGGMSVAFQVSNNTTYQALDYDPADPNPTGGYIISYYSTGYNSDTAACAAAP